MFAKARLDTLSDGIFGSCHDAADSGRAAAGRFPSKADGTELLNGLIRALAEIPPLRPQFRRARIALALQCRTAYPGRLSSTANMSIGGCSTIS